MYCTNIPVFSSPLLLFLQPTCVLQQPMGGISFTCIFHSPKFNATDKKFISDLGLAFFDYSSHVQPYSIP